jgi:site-specific recombinase XerD
LAKHDPLTATKRDIELWLGQLSQRCKPSTVWTAWRHLKGFFTWLYNEGDIDTNPMIVVSKPIVPPAEVVVLTTEQVRALLKTCTGKDREALRDYALLTVMLDTGLRLSEVTQLQISDIDKNGTLRIFGKGRKWRTVSLGTTSSTALSRWTRRHPGTTEALWAGRHGALSTEGVRKLIQRRGQQAGFHLHPHMLRHTFVDNWLRNGGNEVDLARLCGWTTTRMAERYAQHRADERAITAHKSVAPLDSLK